MSDQAMIGATLAYLALVEVAKSLFFRAWPPSRTGE